MAGLAHRIDNEIITSIGIQGRPLKLFIREIGVILCRLSGNDRKPVYASKIKALAKSRGISARCQVVALEYWTRVGFITHFTDDGQYYLKPAPPEGQWVGLEDILFESTIPFRIVWSILGIRAKFAYETPAGKVYWLNKFGEKDDQKWYPALVDCIPQTRATRSRGSRDPAVEQLVQTLKDIHILHVVNDKRRSSTGTAGVALTITAETVAAGEIAFSSSPAPMKTAVSRHPVHPAPSSRAPMAETAPSSRAPSAVIPCTNSGPTVAPVFSSPVDQWPHVPERTLARAGMPADANIATSAVAVLEPTSDVTDPLLATTGIEPMPGPWTNQLIQEIEAELGMPNSRNLPRTRSLLNQAFPTGILPCDIVNAWQEYNYRGVWRPSGSPFCLATLLTGQPPESFIPEVQIAARNRLLRAEVLDPVNTFKRGWNRPTDFHRREIWHEKPLQAGTEKDICILYIKQYGLHGLQTQRRGEYLCIDLPPLTPALQEEFYPAWISLESERPDPDYSLLQQEFTRLQPVPVPTKLELLEQRLASAFAKPSLVAAPGNESGRALEMLWARLTPAKESALCLSSV